MHLLVSEVRRALLNAGIARMTSRARIATKIISSISVKAKLDLMAEVFISSTRLVIFSSGHASLSYLVACKSVLDRINGRTLSFGACSPGLSKKWVELHGLAQADGRQD